VRLPVPSRRRTPDAADALPEEGRPGADPSRWPPTDPTAEPGAEAPDPPKPKAPKRPLYVRLLHLRHIAPNAWQRAVLGEGSLALAVVLVLADVATAWTLLVLPLAVAALVKAHDLLAWLLGRPEVPPPGPRHKGSGRTNGAGPSRGGAVGGGTG
jgi:hypothetical protein